MGTLWLLVKVLCFDTSWSLLVCVLCMHTCVRVIQTTVLCCDNYVHVLSFVHSLVCNHVQYLCFCFQLFDDAILSCFSLSWCVWLFKCMWVQICVCCDEVEVNVCVQWLVCCIVMQVRVGECVTFVLKLRFRTCVFLVRYGTTRYGKISSYK
jgi:hypothetical protein